MMHLIRHQQQQRHVRTCFHKTRGAVNVAAGANNTSNRLLHQLRPCPATEASWTTLTATSRSLSSSSSSVIVPPVLTPPTPSPPPANKGALVDWYDHKVSFSHARERQQLSEEFFQAATRQATDPAWFGPHRIPNAFRNRHALLTMHLWFLHKRLLSDTFDTVRAQKIQDDLFVQFWADTAIRVRREGVTELLVNKHVQKVQQYTWIHLTHYDHIYTKFLEQPQERFVQLRELLARHVLVVPSDAQEFDTSSTESGPALVASKNADLLERLAWYVDVQYHNICVAWPHDQYMEGRLAWVNLPSWEGLQQDKDDDENHQDGNDAKTMEDYIPLPDPWLRNYTLRGDVYYWNPKTDEATWDRPT